MSAGAARKPKNDWRLAGYMNADLLARANWPPLPP